MLTSEQKLDLLEKSLSAGGVQVYTLNAVRAALMNGEMQMFEKGDGCQITRMAETPSGKVLYCLFGFGSLDDVLALQPEIEQFGRDNGCTRWLCEGRPGWLKVLPKHGWKTTSVMFVKELGAIEPEKDR